MGGKDATDGRRKTPPVVRFIPLCRSTAAQEAPYFALEKCTGAKEAAVVPPRSSRAEPSRWEASWRLGGAMPAPCRVALAASPRYASAPGMDIELCSAL